jgi:hypothetical protein
VVLEQVCAWGLLPMGIFLLRLCQPLDLGNGVRFPNVWCPIGVACSASPTPPPLTHGSCRWTVLLFALFPGHPDQGLSADDVLLQKIATMFSSQLLGLSSSPVSSELASEEYQM